MDKERLENKKERQTINNLNSSTSEVSKNAIKTDEEKSMKALVKSTIQKAEGKHWPKSIAKCLKQSYKLLGRILGNELVQGVLKVNALAANQPAPHMIRPGVQLRVIPGQRKLFPPGTVSRYSDSPSSLTRRLYKKSNEDLINSAARRRPPSIDLPINGFPKIDGRAEPNSRVSLSQIARKQKHESDLLKALKLPPNYLDKYQTRFERSLEVGRLLKVACASKSLWIEPNGTLNYREPAIHVYNPELELYMAFEPSLSNNTIHLITYYSDAKSQKIAEKMTDPAWDKNIGSSTKTHELNRQKVAENRRIKQNNKLFGESYKDYYPTVAPDNKLSQAQINEVPEIVQKYEQRGILTPNEKEVLKRYAALNRGWQAHLNNENINLNDARRNLWHNRGVDSSEALLLTEQIDNIIGPSLGDID